MWKLLKTLWPSKTFHSSIKKVGNSTSSKDIANELSTQFSTVEQRLDEHIPEGIEHQYIDTDNDSSFLFSVITYEDLYEQLLSIHPSKKCGVDGLTARLLKSCGESIVPPLVHVYNLSIKMSVFPSIWKTARITALFK